MIYCVIPPELEDELYDKMVEHYAENENVEVIIDRRSSDRRGDEGDIPDEIKERRATRDRRRAQPGKFPSIDQPEDKE